MELYRPSKAASVWARVWMRLAGMGYLGRLAMRIAALPIAPYKGRIYLSEISSKGYVEASAVVRHPQLDLGRNCFIGDRVVIFERRGGGPIKLGDRVQVNRDTVLETGLEGRIVLGREVSLHPGCHIYAYLAPIEIGAGVMLAPNCALYSYDHSLDIGSSIRLQPPSTKGGIVIGEEAWLGFGTIVLSGVTIGKGAAIGAGSVVVSDIPDNAVAIGNPARVVKIRNGRKPG